MAGNFVLFAPLEDKLELERAVDRHIAGRHPFRRTVDDHIHLAQQFVQPTRRRNAGDAECFEGLGCARE